MKILFDRSSSLSSVCFLRAKLQTLAVNRSRRATNLHCEIRIRCDRSRRNASNVELNRRCVAIRRARPVRDDESIGGASFLARRDRTREDGALICIFTMRVPFEKCASRSSHDRSIHRYDHPAYTLCRYWITHFYRIIT